jgi:NAD(P)-dependent dehydrogenase (short-subunit alcohol dehydrogenase family)
MSASSFRADLLVGHVAMVCGGTSAIGAAIGSALAGLGAEVTVSGATPAEADAARERAGFTGNVIALDVRDDPQKSGVILARTPIGRWGEPDDIAAATVFLCSPAAAFVTGVIRRSTEVI